MAGEKRFWRSLRLGAFLLLGVLILALGGNPVQAAKKNTLVKVKATAAEKAQGYTERYKYYNAKGKVTKKAWVTVKVEGKKAKMYFGSDGKAYQAPKVMTFLDNVKTYKIGSATYGFDTKGRMVTGYAASAGFGSKAQFYFFNSKGKLKSSASKSFQSAISKGMTKNCNALLKLLGNPPSKKDVEICLGNDWEGELWTYSDLLQIQVKRHVTKGTRMVIVVSAAQEGL